MPREEKRSLRPIIDDYERRGISIDPETGLQRVPAPPVKPRAVLVMAEYASSGLWALDPDRPHEPHHDEISHELLELSRDLVAKLGAWIDLYWDFADESKPFDCDAFNRSGRNIAVELKRFLGPGIDVYFRPENDEDEPPEREKL